MLIPFSGVLAKENAAFIELPYEGEQEAISMFVFLPKDEMPNGLDNFLNEFSHATIQQALRSRSYKLVDIAMPKISLEGELFLKDVSHLMQRTNHLIERIFVE